MKILITGGAGFVGSNLALAFKQFWPQSKIIALDNLKRRGSELNLPRLRAVGVEFQHGDVRNAEDLDLPAIDLIIECSAEPSVLAGRERGTDYLVHSNFMGTFHTLEFARRHQSAMIFLSTSRVYPVQAIRRLQFKETDTRFVLENFEQEFGVSQNGISENFQLEGARTLYGTTKLASELLITEYVDSYNMPIIINRCGVLTGPWQMGKVDQGVVVLWMARHIFGGSLSYLGYNGSGKQVRDLLHVADLADLLRLQINDLKAHQGQTYNVGGGQEISVSLRELTTSCEQISGNKIKINCEPAERLGDIPWFITDTSKVRQVAKWKPQRDVKSILLEIHDWLIQNEEFLRPILT